MTGLSDLEKQKFEASDELVEERRRGMDPEQLTNWNLRSFRVTDLLVESPLGVPTVFVAYSVFDEDRQCKALVVDRLEVPSLESAPEAVARSHPENWRRLYKTTPCIPYSLRYNSAFQSTNTGGRLALLDDRTLLLSVGDHHLDGLNDSTRASQDSSSDYGKILALGISTGQRSIFALGVRNPQGLFVDATGLLWETEHGPEGGDELNLIRRDANYGWPLTTYGRQYNAPTWPLAASPDRHEGFTVPVYAWVPSIAPSSVIRVPSGSSRWAGDLLVTSLRAGSLFRLRLSEQRVVTVEPIPMGGRIRDIAILGDGKIALWMDSRRLVVLRELSESDKFSAPLVAFSEVERRMGLPAIIDQCASCHSFDRAGSSGSAPGLWGIVGRRVAGSSYSGYSTSLRSLGGVWTLQRIESFLSAPTSFASGTTMPPQLEGNTARAKAVAEYLSRLR